MERGVGWDGRVALFVGRWVRNTYMVDTHATIFFSLVIK